MDRISASPRGITKRITKTNKHKKIKEILRNSLRDESGSLLKKSTSNNSHKMQGSKKESNVTTKGLPIFCDHITIDIERLKRKASKTKNDINSKKSEQTRAGGNEKNEKEVADCYEEVSCYGPKLHINGIRDSVDIQYNSSSLSGEEKEIGVEVEKDYEEIGGKLSKPKKRNKKNQKRLSDPVVVVMYNAHKENEECNIKGRPNFRDQQGENIDRNIVSQINEKRVSKKTKRTSEERIGLPNKEYRITNNQPVCEVLEINDSSASVDLMYSTNCELNSRVPDDSSCGNGSGNRKRKHKKSEKKIMQKSFEHQISDFFTNCGENISQEISNPVCIEMQKKDYIPSNLFGDFVPGFQMKSNSVVSGDELNWHKLTSMNVVSTEKCEVQIGEIASETCENDHQEKHINEFEDLITSQNELNSDVHKLIPVSNINMILALPPGHTLFFKGVLKFQVLVGSFQVLGYEMTDQKKETQTIFSPNGFSLLNIQHTDNIKYTKQMYWQLVQQVGKQYLSNNPAISKLSESNLEDFTTLILLECVSSSLIQILLKYYRNYFISFSSNVQHDNQVTTRQKAEFLNQHTSLKRIKISYEWRFVEEDLLSHNSGPLKFIPFGAKGVGKSTFLRYIINRMLPKVKMILYIDLDPGQCEFTFPGCISATIVDKPLLGPNMTHLREPARCVYLGEVNVINCVVSYMEAVKYIFDWCSSQEYLAGIPWFINTMGFAKGVGVDLAIYTIKLFNPSHVVQIYSASSWNNFPYRLAPAIVNDAKTESISFDINPSLKYSFSYFQSSAERPGGEKSPWGLPAKSLREFAVAAYFSSAVSPPEYSLLNVVPHVLPFSQIKLCVCNEKINYSDYLNAMNANTVALCDVGNKKGLVSSEPGFPEIWVKPPLGPCYGMGIVRGVDMKQKVIFLITPVTEVKLKCVNCLVLGSVKTPSAMFIDQNEAIEEIPYVMEGIRLPLDRNVKVNKAI